MDMRQLSNLTAFSLLTFVIVFSVISSTPFLDERIRLLNANAQPSITINGTPVHNNIYYVRAGEPAPLVLTISTAGGGSLSHLDISHLPPGITVSNNSPSVIQIRIQN